MTSTGLASHWLVGFDSGRMIGRSAWRAISRMTASGKVSGSPEVPMSAVGRSARTIAARSCARPEPRPAASASAGGQASSRLYSSRIEPSSITNPRLSRQPTARTQVVAFHAFFAPAT